ncbi:MAG: tryptophan synthase subunit alpha [Clostridia bacterium]|nr:tryptophan synthase subunit alpha [Clostridia bacterium]
MSKIRQAFSHGKAFIPFLTAGDPDAESTVKFILAMQRAGADIVEIGIPFSDPTAEGVVIQEANIRALSNGMTVEGVFEIVKKVREQSDIPLVFLTYINPVFHYGYERFFAKCEKLGVDGIIIPDMPFEEKGELAPVAALHGVDIISLIAPTSHERIKTIAKDATGYVYAVSSMGVTGVRQKIETDLESMVGLARQVTDIPVAIGFGISTPEQAAKMAGISDGAIVGSAIVKIIEKYGKDAEQAVYDYTYSMKKAVSKA